jgi:polynucleotide 5'-hydroxyl-kinase GRC3/NOL9
MSIHGGKTVKTTVESGKTLLVDGPASVTVVSGKVEAFGFKVENASRIVIREGKRLPFAVEETANFEVILGENAGAEEVDGNTIPPSWAKAFEELLDLQKKPAIAVVMGGVDSGKTSLCTYLINRLIGEKRGVAILDGDVGQSDIGPPCTVAYTTIAKPVTDLFGLKAENAFFVGVTSPSEAVDKVIEGLAAMKTGVLKCAVDFVVVNTDGWVAGEEAVAFKARLIEMLSPDVIFCIRQGDELAPLLVALEKAKTIAVDSPLTVRLRSREKRKNLRELGYIKYLAEAKVKVWSLKRMTIEPNVLCLSRQASEGLLLGLHDAQKKFLGIGVLQEIDSVRKVLKVHTSVAAEPSSVKVGKVRLDETLHEIPALLG